MVIIGLNICGTNTPIEKYWNDSDGILVAVAPELTIVTVGNKLYTDHVFDILTEVSKFTIDVIFIPSNGIHQNIIFKVNIQKKIEDQSSSPPLSKRKMEYI